jgi:aspartyl-tRNA synthetase
MERTKISETKNKAGETASVSGWVESRRGHGKLVFIDLRDATGLLQVVFVPGNEELLKLAATLRTNDVVTIEGKISKRPEKMTNKDMETGNVELSAEKLEIINRSATLPFDITDDGYGTNEEIRLRYRYLDLKRQRLQKNLKMRASAIKFCRDYLNEKGFTEIETPVLTKSTPEGARDYVVPSRLQTGFFYALPQSPQQYKQLLMVAGIEKYFQVARCFRDEDTRGDRQPEFTQLDIEMSFTGQEEILNLAEGMFTEMVKKLYPQKTLSSSPWPRISYKEAAEKYNSDKPDLRKDKNNPDELAFAWIVDFPAFEYRESEKRWDAVHHPFTRPQTEDIEEIKQNPGKILAHQYDLVLNGYEVGGGSLRIYKPELLEAIFEILGHDKKNIREKFGHLLDAFSYGAPPHGGIAPGIDRLVMILQNEPNIREVIAFPKTGDGRDFMMNSPSEIGKDQLGELNLEIKKKKK